MPLFEYRCRKCKKVSEILAGFEEKAATICPHCGGKLKKLHSTPAIQFKGTGWYVTDYAGKGRAESSPEGAAPEKSEPAPKESKKEEKPARKERPAKKE